MRQQGGALDKTAKSLTPSGAFDVKEEKPRELAVHPGFVLAWVTFSSCAALAVFIFSVVWYTKVNPKATSEIINCKAKSCELTVSSAALVTGVRRGPTMNLYVRRLTTLASRTRVSRPF